MFSYISVGLGERLWARFHPYLAQCKSRLTPAVKSGALLPHPRQLDLVLLWIFLSVRYISFGKCEGSCSMWKGLPENWPTPLITFQTLTSNGTSHKGQGRIRMLGRLIRDLWSQVCCALACYSIKEGVKRGQNDQCLIPSNSPLQDVSAQEPPV